MITLKQENILRNTFGSAGIFIAERLKYPLSYGVTGDMYLISKSLFRVNLKWFLGLPALAIAGLLVLFTLNLDAQERLLFKKGRYVTNQAYCKLSDAQIIDRFTDQAGNYAISITTKNPQYTFEFDYHYDRVCGVQGYGVFDDDVIRFDIECEEEGEKLRYREVLTKLSSSSFKRRGRTYSRCRSSFASSLNARQITVAQIILASVGFKPGDPDGKLGPRTRRAIKAYQNYFALPVTSSLDKITYRSLMRYKDTALENWKAASESRDKKLADVKPAAGDITENKSAESPILGKQQGKGALVLSSSAGQKDANAKDRKPPSSLLSSEDAFELAFWNSIKNSKSIEELQSYLKQYPTGRFASLVKIYIRKLNNRKLAQLAPAAGTEKENTSNNLEPTDKSKNTARNSTSSKASTPKGKVDSKTAELHARQTKRAYTIRNKLISDPENLYKIVEPKIYDIYKKSFRDVEIFSNLLNASIPFIGCSGETNSVIGFYNVGLHTWILLWIDEQDNIVDARLTYGFEPDGREKNTAWYQIMAANPKPITAVLKETLKLQMDAFGTFFPYTKCETAVSLDPLINVNFAASLIYEFSKMKKSLTPRSWEVIHTTLADRNGVESVQDIALGFVLREVLGFDILTLHTLKTNAADIVVHGWKIKDHEMILTNEQGANLLSKD